MNLSTSFNLFDVYKQLRLFRRIRKELSAIIAHAEDNHPLDLRLTHATLGSLKFTDAYILMKVLHKYKPKTILEVGSFLGFSTRWLLEVSKSWKPKVTAVDPNIRHRIYDNPRRFVEKLNCEFYPNNLEIVTGFFGHYNDNVYHDYENYEPRQNREYVNQLIKDREKIDKRWERKFDFIFIDGDHLYKSVMENFEIASELLNARGCIAFHDALSWEGVNRALKEMKAKFNQRAEVNIYGGIDKRVLKLMDTHNDGIGLFRFLS